ncbi:TonB-dependent receptor plug domain-containing protein [Alterisphingorhabdus coralli]|uniref:TonB-dependent receptor n=1 Tax=Alterisphingorhabdus coralli TaxID=3071408 RepID=A0AA97F602_9SPHN|nr:TonB-dependent receptor [Parasphingorhabdus sp. SCSIO 66989]WOE74581.1 TonB-dependent receptor [Parasphingorhabdus sp. SCSIO 66989]
MRIETVKATLLCGAGALCTLVTPALAQDGDADAQVDASDKIYIADFLRDDFVTVLGSALEGLTDELNRGITIIGTDEIDSIQTLDITQILERAPGITTTRNGSLGSFTGIRLRGSTSDQVLMLVDGVRLNDPSAPGTGFDFGNILPQNINKVEVLRGANSIIWGSNAIGGIIAVETGGDGDIGSFTAEGGSFGTYSLTGSLNPDLADGLNVSVSGGYLESDGFSSFDGGTEDDGYNQLFVNGRVAYALTSELSFFAQARYADSELDIDGFQFVPPFAQIDTAEFQETSQVSGSAGIEYSGDRLNLRALYSIADINRDNFNPAFGTDRVFFGEGRNERLELRGEYAVTDTVDVYFGLENEETSFDTGTVGDSGLDSVYGLVRFNNDRVNVSAGVRVDDHEQYGTEVTFGADGSLAIGDDGWRVRAAYQEGFRAPSLFQLLSFFGNPNLNPETSQGYEVGIEYQDRNGSGPVAGSVTLFQRDTDNQIDFFSCFGIDPADNPLCDGRSGIFDNILETRARGVEAELVVRPSRRVTARAVYTYVDTENRSEGSFNFGNQLARQPDHALTLAADWFAEEIANGLRLGADLRLVSDSFDNAGNTRPLDGFSTVRFRAALNVTENIEVFGRLENAFDVDYQTAAGFATPGQSAFGGIRLRL